METGIYSKIFDNPKSQTSITYFKTLIDPGSQNILSKTPNMLNVNRPFKPRQLVQTPTEGNLKRVIRRIVPWSSKLFEMPDSLFYTHALLRRRRRPPSPAPDPLRGDDADWARPRPFRVGGAGFCTMEVSSRSSATRILTRRCTPMDPYGFGDTELNHSRSRWQWAVV